MQNRSRKKGDLHPIFQGYDWVRGGLGLALTGSHALWRGRAFEFATWSQKILSSTDECQP